MYYLNMRPCQVREAIEKNVPVILPMGVIEYHAEHLPLGVDSFVAIEAIRRFEKIHPEAVVLPPFYYGAASYAVAKPEGNGTIQVDASHLIPVAEDIFHSLLRVGFRRIHGFIAHQTENYEQGMPTDLAFRYAARHVIFNWLEKNAGEGWWGKEENANYYSFNNNPFAWIEVHACLNAPMEGYDFDGGHADKMETSETMCICPENIDMSLLDDSIWYARSSHDASREYGEASLTSKVKYMEELIYK